MVQSAKTRNFLKALKDKRLVMWLHFLLDIENCLSDVSLVIQANKCTVSDVWFELQSAKQIIASYMTRLVKCCIYIVTVFVFYVSPTNTDFMCKI
ncbi:hypothetical protein DPMN_048298 [Dreissena polymorpha]|uniref:Uncharacterized protein n=1 Tax=Dreissena polymorpha TaxID=45954 RepID=A0A9D4DD46_DREPO|nr:hypothetical protein DPMN_048298 [Dreissena polymorpha]